MSMFAKFFILILGLFFLFVLSGATNCYNLSSAIHDTIESLF
jgi:hypothetical protein